MKIIPIILVASSFAACAVPVAGMAQQCPATYQNAQFTRATARGSLESLKDVTCFYGNSNIRGPVFKGVSLSGSSWSFSISGGADASLFFSCKDSTPSHCSFTAAQ